MANVKWIKYIKIKSTAIQRAWQLELSKDISFQKPNITKVWIYTRTYLFDIPTTFGRGQEMELSLALFELVS
jgi:hypothetical protein